MYSSTYPDFLIVGAPKCGTTALCRYLSQHPDIFMPTPDKTYFFGQDLNIPRSCDRPDDYRALFEPGQGKCCGEGTPYYLYSETAAQEIVQFNPQTKIIILLRDPIEVTYSLYYQRLSNSTDSETILNFEAALDAERDRALGRRLPPAYPDPKMVIYTEIAKFYKQVKRYVDTFPSEQVHIILYQDFRSNLPEVYRHILTFLGVDSTFAPTFQVVNANTTWRSRRIQAWVEHPSPQLKALLKPLGVTGQRLYPLYRKLVRWNSQTIQRPPLSPVTHDRLRHLYQEDVAALSQLIGRSLDHWLQMPEGHDS